MDIPLTALENADLGSHSHNLPFKPHFICGQHHAHHPHGIIYIFTHFYTSVAKVQWRNCAFSDTKIGLAAASTVRCSLCRVWDSIPPSSRLLLAASLAPSVLIDCIKIGVFESELNWWGDKWKGKSRGGERMWRLWRSSSGIFSEYDCENNCMRPCAREVKWERLLPIRPKLTRTVCISGKIFHLRKQCGFNQVSQQKMVASGLLWITNPAS